MTYFFSNNGRSQCKREPSTRAQFTRATLLSSDNDPSVGGACNDIIDHKQYLGGGGVKVTMGKIVNTTLQVLYTRICGEDPPDDSPWINYNRQAAVAWIITDNMCCNSVVSKVQ